VIDVFVAGDGPAGAAAALTLARAGRRVALAHRARARFKIGEALPGGVRPILRDLGVWDAFAAAGHLPSFANRTVWGGDAPVDVDFIHDPNGHGWHVDRSRFETLLLDAARDAGVEVIEGRVPARMVIDATGRRAAIARSFGARRHRTDRLVAVYAAFRTEDVDSRTLIEATPDGWWYTSLVPHGRRVVAFLTDAEFVPRPLRSASGFLAAVSETAYVRVGGAPELGPFTAPAHSAWLDPPCGDGWLAVGDAALAFDPLSSQGMLTALYGGLVAGQAVDAALDGKASAMRAYRDRLTIIRLAYERNRLAAYRLEPRWPERPFWSRRLAAPPTRARRGAASSAT
jgi:flavin-dependent dehydrogenase